MDKEQYFIDQISDKSDKYIGDDGVVIGKYVYSMDAFCENVHFKTSWFSLEQIAIKAMLVNISDAIVMNSKPKYALITVAIPKDYTKSNLKELAKGFKKTAKQYGIKIIGGDTISNTKLDISITIVSTTKQPVFRKGAKVDDLLCYTGDLGSCKRDLKKLLKGKVISNKSKFIIPRLNPQFFYEAAPYINCSIDISDGLFFELERLSKINKIGFDFFNRISKKIGCSGEEYEILFSFDPQYKTKIEQIAKKHNVSLNIIAKAIKGKYRSKCKGHHF